MDNPVGIYNTITSLNFVAIPTDCIQPLYYFRPMITISILYTTNWQLLMDINDYFIIFIIYIHIRNISAKITTFVVDLPWPWTHIISYIIIYTYYTHAAESIIINYTLIINYKYDYYYYYCL